jgi:hypothetical protein
LDCQLNNLILSITFLAITAEMPARAADLIRMLPPQPVPALSDRGEGAGADRRHLDAEVLRVRPTNGASVRRQELAHVVSAVVVSPLFDRFPVKTEAAAATYPEALVVNVNSAQLTMRLV